MLVKGLVPRSRLGGRWTWRQPGVVATRKGQRPPGALTRDYLPEFAGLARGLTLPERAAALGAQLEPVPIPWDCADGFFHTYLRRPAAYLQPAVRQAISVWARVGPAATDRAVRALRADLVSGRCGARNHGLTTLPAADLGARPPGRPEAEAES